ncbi:hypothetical protein ACFY9N_07230 [Microbacterium sp. NPDC008134]|uniref:hypothetical protein n=1 Tax=Microbacterium sp. NPDC008134 TaxID=3364183 RepID=UPI0036E36590
MISDSDDALSWDGDDDASRARPTPVKREKKAVDTAPPVVADRVASPVEDSVGEAPDPDSEEGEESAPLSTAMLLITGVVGGVYLLYSIGWVVGGLRLKPLANFFVADEMFLPWFVLAVAAPALWFLATWVLTRGRASWVRASLLLLGVVLLVPWPFVTVGVIGA